MVHPPRYPISTTPGLGSGTSTMVTGNLFGQDLDDEETDYFFWMTTEKILALGGNVTCVPGRLSVLGSP